MQEEIEIGKLYDQLLAEGYAVEEHGKYDLIRCKGIEVLTYGNKYTKVDCVSRHRTSKHLIKITVKSVHDVTIAGSGGEVAFGEYDVTVTTDHICMVYTRDRFFENVDAKNLRVGDFVSVYDDVGRKERIGEIRKIEDLGTTEEYVYDLMVEDEMHSFYANDVLIHNSIFLNLEPVTTWMKKESANGGRPLDDKIRNWPQKARDQLWKTVSKFVDDDVNAFVRGLAHDFCHTSQQNILTYELEYMTDCGIFEAKKHYYIHKIFEEGDAVDKLKASGIELKKGNVPVQMKEFLQDMYKGVLLGDWKEADYQMYVNDLYAKFKTFSIDEISFWKGYNTERQAAGFLQMAQTVNPATGKTVGTTGIARAATYYNQIIEKLGLGRRYEQLRLGDKARFCYIDENNPYRINVIAYKDGQWPAEFDEMFKPDYKKMFEKIILDPLKGYRKACGFADTDPSKQVVFDIFSL